MVRKVRVGMVGGGAGAFIGEIHRKALSLDGELELVAGAFHRDPERSCAFGASLGLASSRQYRDWQEMLSKERERPTDERVDLISIVTPNDVHAPIAIAALEAGFHVMSEKPAARTLDEALEIEEAVRQTGLIYAVAQTYLGYPMVRQARALVADGAIGPIRKIIVEYVQGWLSQTVETDGQKQAAWRTDPVVAGPGGAIGDIGVHAASLAEYIAGSPMTELCASLTAFGSGRVLDDDASLLFRMENGAQGVLTASQICAGEENGLSIRIYGEEGGLSWRQEEPNTLWHAPLDGPAQRWRAGADRGYLSPAVRSQMRTPAGHPEGYIEAFANLYRDVAAAVRDLGEGEAAYPGIDMGLSTLAFVDAILRNTRDDEKWTRVKDRGAL